MTPSKTVTSIKIRTSSSESEAAIATFMDNHPQGMLATIDTNGHPQGSVINVCKVDNNRFAFMTKRDTRKHTNLQANAAVVFVAFDPFSRTEAELEGVAYVIDDTNETQQILKIFDEAAKKGRWHVSPYVSARDDFVLYAIYPRKLHMVTYWDQASGMKAFHESIDFDITAKD